MYQTALAALKAAVTPQERSAALGLLQAADVNALTVNDKAAADIVDQSVWTARIKGSDRLPLEGIRAFKQSSGRGKYRYDMKRVDFGTSINEKRGMEVKTFDLDMELDAGDGETENVEVTFTKVFP